MNTNSNGKPSKAALTGLKMVLVSASIAGSIGLWGALSEKAMQVAASNVSDDSDATRCKQPQYAADLNQPDFRSIRIKWSSTSLHQLLDRHSGM